VLRLRASVGVFMFAYLLIGAIGGARADYYGAWRYAPSGGNSPENCIVAGTGIDQDASPDKHNLAASNTCHTSHTVHATLWHFDSGNHILNQCDPASATNYVQCQVQASTISTDYWEWFVWVVSDSNFIVCAQNPSSHNYQDCFQSID
jgi:hypothetical protein